MNLCIDGQQSADGQSDRITLQTTGELLCRESAWYITYSERCEDGSEEKITLKLQPDRVVMLRSGSGRMEFFPGTDTVCNYHTAAGFLPLRVRTHGISVSISASGGSVKLTYSLLTEGGLLSRNSVRITLTPLFE